MAKGEDGYKTAVRVAGLRSGGRAVRLAPGELYDGRRGMGLRFPVCGTGDLWRNPDRGAGADAPSSVRRRTAGPAARSPDRTGRSRICGKPPQNAVRTANPSAGTVRCAGEGGRRYVFCFCGRMRAQPQNSRSIKSRAAVPAFLWDRMKIVLRRRVRQALFGRSVLRQRYGMAFFAYII